MGRGIEPRGRSIFEIKCFAIKQRLNGWIECNAVDNEWFTIYYYNGACGTPRCPFYKTPEQHSRDLVKVAERLARIEYGGDRYGG